MRTIIKKKIKEDPERREEMNCQPEPGYRTYFRCACPFQAGVQISSVPFQGDLSPHDLCFSPSSSRRKRER